MAARNIPASPESLTYEQAFAELEETVRRLSGDALALDAALALFERGQALAAHCNALLDAAELKVKQLAPAAEGYYETDFEAEER